MRIARVMKDHEILAAFVDRSGQVFEIRADDIGQPDGRLSDIAALIALEPAQLEAVGERLGAAAARGDRAAIVPDRWLPPVARPGKVIGVAMNNSAFAPASFRYFSSPSYFMKAPSSLIGCGEPIVMREEYGLTHPEAELACVIGRRVSNLPVAEARSAIFGYTIINDVTSVGLKDEDSLHLEFSKPMPGVEQPTWRRSRDAEDHDIYLTYHLRSKCTDTFGPIGPWITTADEVADPDALSIRAWLGERLIAEDSTARLSFSISEVLSHLSRYVTLDVGDVVHFGTAVDPKRFALREANILRDPSPIRIEIEGLGTLINPVEIRD